jgi:Transposase IS4
MVIIIRINCQQNWLPATHVSIDKAMLPFSGRSKDTVNMKYKPIKEDFKVWVLADQGYVYNWLWFSGHSERDTEIIGKKDWKFKIDKNGITACFAPNFTVVIYLI